MRTLVRASLVAATLVATGVVPLSASANVTGVASDAATVDAKAPTVLNRLPGRSKPGEITLTRGLS